ncbi:MAG: hypothetical protein GXP32_06440, partial [Kiritimatiellaeota bacterium]|nr:hypothetical protein [Kiritimatiellota bacterium]
AALAAAKVQADSLNLIGEINLLKACTVLVSDFADGNDDDESVQQASANLTEMQERIAFVGPLLGVGAAQMAAKNNGMLEYDQVTKDMLTYIGLVSDEAIYGDDEFFKQEIEGYTWREAYIKMLSTLAYQKMAAAPAMHLPEVSPRDFMDSGLYDAILSEYWCHDFLRTLIKSDANFTGKWWQGLVESVSFIEESELLPLYVKYTGFSTPFDTAKPYLEGLASDRLLTVSDEYDKDEPEDTDGIDNPIPLMRWCQYDSYWSYNVPGDHWVEGSSQLYLRRGLRPEYQYAGPVALMECQADNPKFTWLTGGYKAQKFSEGDNIIAKDETPASPTVVASAVAKPLGALESDGTNYSPVVAEMILPVFDKARLTPVMMPPGAHTTAIGSNDFQLYKFLRWMDTVDDLDSATVPDPSMQKYLIAFQRLNDPTWRHKGYNPSYSYPGSGEVVEYDPDSDTGAGYLQQPTPHPEGAPEGMPNDGYWYQPEYNDDGELTGYSDEIVGIRWTNEDTCDYIPPGGGPGPGVHRGGGPGKLH